MTGRVNRLGTGHAVVVGHRVSRPLFEAIVGAFPDAGIPNELQAVMVSDANIITAYDFDAAETHATLERINDELRKAGIEHPLGHPGVQDLVTMLTTEREEVDGILADVGLPYTATGADGVRGLATAFEAAKAEVRRLDEVVKQLRTELHQVTTGGSLYDPEDTIQQPVFNPEELP